jgi:creatinine amidohydrolase
VTNYNWTHRVCIGLLSLACFGLTGARAAATEGVRPTTDDMTWVELQAAVRAGKTTVIIPVGGSEQTGPHVVLGKHNIRVKALATKIAQTLGNTLVAPVVAYVPEGSISPPAAHMRFAGTISVSNEAFMGILEGAARSFRQHGLTDIVFIGDHGGYQAQLAEVATKLNRAWAKDGKDGARVHFVAAYYQATQASYIQALRARGLSDHQIGLHGGVADTSLLMAVDPDAVHPGLFEEAAKGGPAMGTQGDPRRASVELGQIGVDLIVTQTVAALKLALKR